MLQSIRVRGPIHRVVARVQSLRARGPRSLPEAAAAKVDENRSSRFPNAPSRISDQRSIHHGKLFPRPNKQRNAKAPRRVRNLFARSPSRTSGISRRRASQEQDARALELAKIKASRRCRRSTGIKEARLSLAWDSSYLLQPLPRKSN